MKNCKSETKKNSDLKINNSEKRWTVIKDLHNSVFIDFKNKIFRCSETAWFKFENTDRLFIFALDVPKGVKK